MRLEEFLAAQAEKKNFKKGDLVFSEGTQAEAAYCVLDGQVEIFKGPPGAQSVMAVLGPGEIFGEMALLRFNEYTLSARAASDAVLYVISPAMLQEQVRATHPLIKAILDMLVERINTVNEVLIDIDRTSNQA